MKSDDLNENCIENVLDELNGYCNANQLNSFTLTDLSELYSLALSHTCRTNTVDKSIGFSDNRFIYSDSLYEVRNIEGTEFLYEMARIDASGMSFEKRGTLSEWKNEINSVCCQSVEMQILMCSAISAMLTDILNMRFAGIAVNIVSSDGSFFRKASYFISSVFGNHCTLSQPFRLYPAQKSRFFIPAFMKGYRFPKDNNSYPIYLKKKSSYLKGWHNKSCQHGLFRGLIEIDSTKLNTELLPNLSVENYGTAVGVIADYMINNRQALKELFYQKQEYVRDMLNQHYQVDSIEDCLPQIDIFILPIRNTIISCAILLVCAEIFNNSMCLDWGIQEMEHKILYFAQRYICQMVSHKYARLFRTVRRLCIEGGKRLKLADKRNNDKGSEKNDLGFIQQCGRRGNTYSINLYVQALPYHLRKYFNNVKRKELGNRQYNEKNKQVLSYSPVTNRHIIARIGGKCRLQKFYGYILNDYLAKQYPNSTLVTACGGGAKELNCVNKYNFREIVYNEISPAIFTLFEVLGDDGLYRKLSKKLHQINKESLTEEYRTACKYSRTGNTKYIPLPMTKRMKVMLAYYGFIIGNYSYSGVEGNFLFSKHKAISHTRWFKGSKLRCAKRKESNIELFHLKYRGWKIRNNDLLEILEEYRCSDDTVIFIDPPYLSDKQSESPYYFSSVNHSEMVGLLLQPDTRAKIILCGMKSENSFHTYQPLVDKDTRIIVEYYHFFILTCLL